jgi:hypothetical protein
MAIWGTWHDSEPHTLLVILLSKDLHVIIVRYYVSLSKHQRAYQFNAQPYSPAFSKIYQYLIHTSPTPQIFPSRVISARQ